MPTLPITITDEQYTTLQWAAAQRKISVADLVADTVAAFLGPLKVAFKDAQRAEAAKLFADLSVAKQLEVLQLIKDAKDG